LELRVRVKLRLESYDVGRGYSEGSGWVELELGKVRVRVI